MKITVIGAGHDVLVADARGREVVAAEVLASGARAAKLDASVAGRDVIVLAIPFSVQPDLADLIATVPAETVVVDTSNYYPLMMGPVEDVDNGQVESVWSQEKLGHPIVKAWNAALAGTQQTKGLPAGAPNRIAIPVAADSAGARSTVMQLVNDTGFDPFDAGAIADSWRQQPGTPAYCTELGLHDLAAALASADKNKAPGTRDRLMEHFGSLKTEPSLNETVAINRSAHQ